MPGFFATVPRGLEKVLEQELQNIGIKKTTLGIAGVSFHGSWADCYRANLKLVSPSRILYPVLDFPAYEPDHIYHNVLKHDFTKYINIEQTLAVDSSVRDSIIRDLRIVALKTKDAVVDQFRTKFGSRPNVDTDNPHMQLSVRLVKNMCTVSLDTSGGSLHMRGYRTQSTPAPLKENLAAALIKMTEWNEMSSFLDPMCGSGTLCIEAALIALKIPPGSFRRRFGFQNWKTYQKDAFLKLSEETSQEYLERLSFKIFGSDINSDAVGAARIHSENAGTQRVTDFKTKPISDLEPPAESGTLICNPPYGERLGNTEDLKSLYEQLGQKIKSDFKNWRVFVLCSDDELLKALGMRPEKSFHVFNGALPCRFIKL